MFTDHQEVEWQYDADDIGAVARWLQARPPDSDVQARFQADVEQIDAYLDTDDWRVLRAGYALRVRRKTRGGAEATLKSLNAAAKGVRQRHEINEDLSGEPDPRSIAQAVFDAPGAVGARVRAVAGARGNRTLRVLFEVHTRRSMYELTCDNQRAGEVDLDDAAFPGGDSAPNGAMQRIEIEVQDADARAIKSFVKRMRKACDLRDAALSKFEAGLRARGLQPRQIAGEDFGTTRIEPNATSGDLAYAVLRRHFAAMLVREPGVRFGESVRDVHQMRVATRRLRAAMSLFRDFLPERANRMREELGWFASALGALRDHDVMIKQVEGWAAEGGGGTPQSAFQAVAALLRQQRATAQQRLLAVLDSRRYERLVSAFTRFLKKPDELPDAAGTPARATAPALIRRRYRKTRKLGDQLTAESPPAEYHRARIAAKRLRYSLEFVARLYGKPAKRALSCMVALQNMLGLFQDTRMAVARLRALSAPKADATPQPPPATLLALEQAAQRYEHLGAALLLQFPAVYAEMKGKDWRNLKKALRKKA
ncbi:MAG: CHAD domain-containing protein [Chloroflexi bacterium]|nr:CHAD domain-containing protein [Chloroflexota bacterium]MCL5275979.1 CHAD domain-containing protein [Chloroflexota bacterium]